MIPKQGGKWWHLPRQVLIIALPCLIASCGGGGGGGETVVEMESVTGQVIDGYIAGALVCADENRNFRCDTSEPQARSGTEGRYALVVAKGSDAPLLAEITVGQPQDSAQPGIPVDVSYRMASPRQYGTTITPFSTLVLLTGVANFPVAEELVRDAVGLPPRSDITLAAPAPAGSLKQAVAKAVVEALKATAGTVDYGAGDALARVAAAFPPSLTDLPVLTIATKDAAPIESKEIYVDATFTLTNPALATVPTALNGKIRGRGHSTWLAPKKPFKIQFSNDAAYAAVPEFLGMKKNRNWAVLAEYYDRSLLRNKLALSLGNSVVFADGLKWTPSGQHIEVWLNGDYLGVYLFTEDIRIDPARLNIKKMSSKPEANEVDGGYIVEVDERLDCYNQGDINLQLVTAQNTPICIDTPDEGAITQAQLAYIKGLLLQVEKDLYQANNIDRIDAVSFADWYLLEELFRNVDANFFSSDFMWKDTDAATDPRDRKLNMGPIWDFDRGAGNVNYYDAWLAEGCWTNQVHPLWPDQRNWFGKIFDNPDFLALTLQRWKAKRPALGQFINASVDTYARRLAQAQQRNFVRWPVFGVPLTNYYVFSTYDEEVAFVKDFLNRRMAWLDKAFESPATYAALCRQPLAH